MKRFDTHASTLTWSVPLLIALTGLAILVEAPESFDEKTYVGVLFIAAAIGAVPALPNRRTTIPEESR